MVVVPLANPASNTASQPAATETESNYWLRVAAGSSLVAGGILLLYGKHRAGLLAAAIGTSLAMIDQQDTVSDWWAAVPGLIDDAGRMLGQVQGVVDSFESQRDKLSALIRKPSSPAAGPQAI